MKSSQTPGLPVYITRLPTPDAQGTTFGTSVFLLQAVRVRAKDPLFDTPDVEYSSLLLRKCPVITINEFVTGAFGLGLNPSSADRQEND
ncbi:hypothetical protein M514_26864 [Trichuris suis]|uniref:Uncharacterized protein n=1 Tax=Trichuris suis TaxID=68888 RepID=A0A085MUS0_9BILA|nr:hypothetical protein M514_26864 [Trichuris suis]